MGPKSDVSDGLSQRIVCFYVQARRLMRSWTRPPGDSARAISRCLSFSLHACRSSPTLDDSEGVGGSFGHELESGLAALAVLLGSEIATRVLCTFPKSCCWSSLAMIINDGRYGVVGLHGIIIQHFCICSAANSSGWAESLVCLNFLSRMEVTVLLMES
jgi:hypothetical protein